MNDNEYLDYIVEIELETNNEVRCFACKKHLTSKSEMFLCDGALACSDCFEKDKLFQNNVNLNFSDCFIQSEIFKNFKQELMTIFNSCCQDEITF